MTEPTLNIHELLVSSNQKTSPRLSDVRETNPFLTSNALLSLSNWLTQCCAEILPDCPSLGERAWRILFKFLAVKRIKAGAVEVSAWISISIAALTFHREISLETLPWQIFPRFNSEDVCSVSRFILEVVTEDYACDLTIVELCSLLLENTSLNHKSEVLLPLVWDYTIQCYNEEVVADHSIAKFACAVLVRCIKEIGLGAEEVFKLWSEVGEIQECRALAEQLANAP